MAPRDVAAAKRGFAWTSRPVAGQSRLMRLLRMLGMGVCCVVPLLSTGCSKSYVEQVVRDALQREIGQADSYRVQVLNTSEDELRRGFVREMKVDGTRIERAGAPVVHQVSTHILDLQADPATRSFRSARQAEVTVTLRDQDLQKFMRSQHADLAGARLYMLKSSALIVLDDFPLTHEKLRMTGTVAVEKDMKVNFIPKDAFLGDRIMDEQMRDLLLEQVNPVADLSKWPVSLRVDRIACAPGLVRVTATLQGINAAAWPKVP